jgi:TP901 family phage tail tape measure protein
MGASVKDLLVNILADDSNASKVIDGFGGKVEGVNKKVAAGAAAVGAAVLAGAGMAVDAAMDVDGAVDTIAQGTGATGAALDGLTDSFKNVTAEVPASFDVVGGAIADLNTRVGMTGEPLEKLATQIIRVGEFAGQSEIDINSFTGAANLFQVPAERLSDSMDWLYGVSQATGVSINELTAGIEKNGAGLAQLNFGFEQSAQMIGTFDKAGLNADKMLAGMGKALVKLAKDNEEPVQAFDRTIAEIDEFIKAGDQAAALNLAGTVFGTKNAPQFIQALQTGALSLNDIVNGAGMASQSILDMAETTDDFPEKWQKFQNRIQLAMAELGEKLLPLIDEGFDKLEPVIQWFTDNIDVVGKVGAVIGIVAGAVLGITGAMKVFAAVQAIQTAAQWASNAAWLASPVTWIVLGIVAAVAALIAIGVLVVKNWDDIAAWFKGLWEDISNWFGGVWEGIKSGISGFIDWVSDIFFNWTPLGLIIKNWGAISDFFGNFWDGVLDKINTAKEWIGGKIEDIVGFFTSIPEKIGNAFAKVGDGLKSVAHGIATAVAFLWNHSLGAINFTVPDWIPGIGGKHFDMPNITVPALAEGGIVTAPTLALLGEAGPEAVIPLPRSHGSGGDRPGRWTVDVPVEVKVDGSVLARVLRRVQAREAF